jgi:hypothetical protein
MPTLFAGSTLAGVGDIRWRAVSLRAAIVSIIATVAYLATRHTTWTVGSFVLALAIFFVPAFLLWVIVDAGGSLLADEERRNRASHTEPSPIAPESEWRRWRRDEEKRGQV